MKSISKELYEKVSCWMADREDTSLLRESIPEDKIDSYLLDRAFEICYEVYRLHHTEKEMKDKQELAMELFNHPRGNLIISQALSLGIDKLEEVEEEFREISNIADMKTLLEGMFPIYTVIKEAEKLGSCVDETDA